MTSGIAFDFNGVIVDDELIHYRAFAHAVKSRGVVLTREHYWEKYLAFDDRKAMDAMSRDYGIDLSDTLEAKIAHYMELVGETPPFFPGAVEAVRALAARFPMIIVSGARREEIEASLRAGNIAECFLGIVAAEDVVASKPDPEPYRRGIEILGFAPETIVAIEDSVGGIASAKGAGLKVIAVEQTYRASELTAADIVVPGITDVVAAL